MANYRIVAEIDTSKVTSGKDKIRQDLSQVDTAAAKTKANLAGIGSGIGPGGAASGAAGLASSLDRVATTGARAAGALTPYRQAISEILRLSVPASNSISGLGEVLGHAEQAYSRGTMNAAQFATVQSQVASRTTELAAILGASASASETVASATAGLSAAQESAATAMEGATAISESLSAAMAGNTAAEEGNAAATAGNTVTHGENAVAMEAGAAASAAATTATAANTVAKEANVAATGAAAAANRGFAAFLSGPWGLALQAAAVGVIWLIDQLSGMSEEETSATTTTIQNTTATEALSRAKSALGAMFDLTTGKVRDNTEATRLNTLAVATNLQLQAQQQLLQSRAQIGAARALPGVINAEADALPFLLGGARETLGYQSAVQNRAILAQNGMTFNGIRPTEAGRANALLQLGAKELSLRNDAAREADHQMRQQLLQAADQTHSLMEAVNNQVQGIASQRVAERAIQSAISGQLASDFKTPHQGRAGRQGSHADPVGNFFRRLEGERAVAGTPPGIQHRLADSMRDFTNAVHRAPSAGPGGEAERIESIVRETEARETLLHLTTTYTDAAEREYQTITELGIRRKMHNAVLEEQARLGRALSPMEEAVVREGVKNVDAYQRQHAAIEQLDGSLQDYSDNITEYLTLLHAGSITQAQFNILVGATPFQRQVDDLEAALGGLGAYEAQMRQINTTIEQYHELIDKRARLSRSDPNYLSPEAAAAQHAALGGRSTGTTNDNIGVEGGTPNNLHDRMVAALNRQRRAQVGEFDQGLGGNFAYRADVQSENDLNAERLETLRKFLEDGRLLREEYDARIEAEHDRHNQKLTEMDRARYQTALHAASQGFGDLADALKGFAGEHSKVYRTMFIASKAFAIAEAILGIQTAIAQAMKMGFPAAIVPISAALSLGASIIANINAVTAQFREGGYTGDGSPDDVAGMVHRGEFVMPAGPTRENRAVLEAMRSGASMRSASGAGSRMGGVLGGDLKVNIHNYGGSGVEVRRGLTPGEVDVMIDEKIKKDSPKAVAADMANEYGKTGKALKAHYGVTRDRK